MNDLNDAILKFYGGVHMNSLNSLLHLDEPDESEETMHLQMINPLKISMNAFHS